MSAAEKKALEALHEALRDVADVTQAQSQVSAVWVSGDGSTDVFVEVDGERR